MKTEKVLLVEPAYPNKFPPLGLMKIATAHRLRGDEVTFCRGNNATLRDKNWDRIYITTLFTFHWNLAIGTINYYSKGKIKPLVGGVLASLLPEDLASETSIIPHVGPYTEKLPGLVEKVGLNNELSKIKDIVVDRGIDALPPDYEMFHSISVPYDTLLRNSYLLRTTRGCMRDCAFCGVKRMEPTYEERLPLAPLISYMTKKWGDRRNLILLDDNVLFSKKFDSIVDELYDLGFKAGSKHNGHRRCVDFNQGLDIRLLTKRHLKKLSTIELRPLRLAFDSYSLHETYTKKIMLAIDCGFKEISSYVLYNYNDTPSDLYNRLLIGCQINERYKSRIYSFPMKYIPCSSKDRHYISAYWTRRQIRGVQCILNATHGIAPTKLDFFKRAFGDNEDRFLRIIQMPENYIIKRSEYLSSGQIGVWNKDYDSLSTSERSEALHLISGGKNRAPKSGTTKKINAFLCHYVDEYHNY